MRYLVLVLLVGCGPKAAPEPPPVATPGEYDNSLFQLASGFAAQEGCSCLFVMGRDLDFCKAWIRVSPDVARIKVDPEAKTVTAKALGMGRKVAVFTDEQTGCVLQEVEE